MRVVALSLTELGSINYKAILNSNIVGVSFLFGEKVCSIPSHGIIHQVL